MAGELHRKPLLCQAGGMAGVAHACGHDVLGLGTKRLESTTVGDKGTSFGQTQTHEKRALAMTPCYDTQQNHVQRRSV